MTDEIPCNSGKSLLLQGILGSVKSFSQIGLQAWGKMKSVGNGGILNGSLQMLHIHVLFVTPLGTSHMA